MNPFLTGLLGLITSLLITWKSNISPVHPLEVYMRCKRTEFMLVIEDDETREMDNQGFSPR